MPPPTFFFFTDSATTEIYTLSLHDALPIFRTSFIVGFPGETDAQFEELCEFVEEMRFERVGVLDRKSTRLNSSHVSISYAVFCLKKKKKKNILPPSRDGAGHA